MYNWWPKLLTKILASCFGTRTYWWILFIEHTSDAFRFRTTGGLYTCPWLVITQLDETQRWSPSDIWSCTEFLKVSCCRSLPDDTTPPSLMKTSAPVNCVLRWLSCVVVVRRTRVLLLGSSLPTWKGNKGEVKHRNTLSCQNQYRPWGPFHCRD